MNSTRSDLDLSEAMRRAGEMLSAWKGADYAFGPGAFDAGATGLERLGRRALLIRHESPWMAPWAARFRDAARAAGVEIVSEENGAAPNAPFADVERLRAAIVEAGPDVVVVLGAGSTIDAAKAANALATLEGTGTALEDLFGTGRVTGALEEADRIARPLAAHMFAASSAAHLTRYANATDRAAHQKLLIIDNAITPSAAAFDYDATRTCPADLVCDGALDGVAHLVEVAIGIEGKTFDRLAPVVEAGLTLIVGSLERRLADSGDHRAVEAIGLGTDLGGRAIMLGGTNGAHLNSFSFVDILSHGRACALMNPYYIALFGPNIEARLRVIAPVYQRAGHLSTSLNLDGLDGRDLGLAVAEAMLSLSRAIGFPTRLSDVEGFTEAHMERALAAAKRPELVSKLKQMPRPMSVEDVDERMGRVLEAARVGDPDIAAPQR